LTVETDNARAQYPTNGTTGPWTVPFYFLASSELDVTYTSATGVDTALVLDVDFSVVGAGVEAGGTVTTTTAYATGGLITILRDVAFVQQTEYVDGDGFPAKSHERGLDRLTMLAQQLREGLSRALRFAASETNPPQFPAAAQRANKIMGFDALGNFIPTIPTSGSAAAVLIQLADPTQGDLSIAGKAPYTGSVARNQRQANADVVTSAALGAPGDGTNQDAALGAAFANAKVTNGLGTFKKLVNILSGYYAMTAGIAVPLGSWLRGEGVNSTRIDCNYATASGLPLLTWTSAPDWRVEGIRFEGEGKSAGLLFNGSCYYGVADQIHVNGFKNYGFKLVQAAQSTFRSVSMYSASAVTDVGFLFEGGSMMTVLQGQLDTNSIGMASSTSGLGSGPCCYGTSFGRQYPAHKIGNGDALWDLGGNYYEGNASFTSSDVFAVGNYNGGGGAAQTMVNWFRNRVAGTAMNDIVMYNARQFNMWGNELGVNVTVQSSTTYFVAWGNNSPNGKTITDQAQYSDVMQRNDRRQSSPAGTRVESIDQTGLGDLAISFNRALSTWIKRTRDALSFDWRLGSSTTNKMTLANSGDLSLPGGLFPGLLGAAPAQQAVSRLWVCTGVPSASFGTNGDYALRSDASGANTHLYFKASGAWTGIV
jgi:hypothetical protein